LNTLFKTCPEPAESSPHLQILFSPRTLLILSSHLRASLTNGLFLISSLTVLYQEPINCKCLANGWVTLSVYTK
jgi:hypothetical protein